MIKGRFSAAVLGGACVWLSAGAALAQEGAVSREVVQALPSSDVTALNNALRRLAINGKNLSALIDAGNAALALGDQDAALGFFGRAQEVAPNNAQVKLGLASVYMRSEKPIEALRYFSEAEQAGALAGSLASDRGLAYDLLGDNARAQQSYRAALAQGSNPEVQRRLALSYAIAGDRANFNKTLRPLVLEKDVAAYRTRAFGLAILGEINEAKGLVTTVIPRDLASRIIPYLEFMPRLTKAQQAAAANLGIFPRAAEIGREDPAIIAFRAQAQRAATGTSAAQVSGTDPARPAPPSQAPLVAAERHWVQLAAGRDREALIQDWNRVRRRASSLLDAYHPHVVESGGMSRLLVGPLRDEDASLALVTALARKRVDSLGIMTPGGMKVDQLQ